MISNGADGIGAALAPDSPTGSEVLPLRSPDAIATTNPHANESLWEAFLCHLCFLAIYPLWPIWGWALWIGLFGFLPKTRIPLGVYLAWCMVDPSPNRSQWRWGTMACRRCFVWRYVQKYFPIRLQKTAELDPQKTYLFGCHPHGVSATSIALTFGSDAAGFSETFPGIQPCLATISMIMKVPFFREILLMCGLRSVSRKLCEDALNSGPGRALALVPGGAQEALDAGNPTPDNLGNADITLLHRKGFVRLALKAGASLVPTYTFGENHIWHALPNIRGTRWRAIQDWIQKTTSFSIPFFLGRASTLGIFPFRRPITVVCGAPIHLPKVEDPTQDQIDHFHGLYVSALRDLYNAHHKVVPGGSSAPLNIY